MALNNDKAQEWANILKAIAHSTRLQILDELRQGTRCVTDIEQILPASQTNISQHLSVLRNAKLVDFAQDGAVRCYYVSRPELVNRILESLASDYPVIRRTKEQINQDKEKKGTIKHPGTGENDEE